MVLSLRLICSRRNSRSSLPCSTSLSKAGYLFDIGPLRVGPIAGLNYVNARIAGYTETGDILITQIVDGQDIDSLTGSAGVQLRFPFALGAGLYSPFVNVTAEHDFLGSGRTITTTQVTTPLLPVLTPSDDRDRTYGRVTGGVAANLGTNMDAMLNASTTFARAGGNEFAINGGLRLRF
jgi:outer membrane autotransporter protein